MRYLLALLPLMGGCALFGPPDPGMKREFARIAGEAVEAGVTGDWFRVAGAGVSAIMLSMYGTHKVRNRARRLRGEPVGRPTPLPVEGPP